MIRFYGFVLLSFVSALTEAATALETLALLNGRVTMSVPAGFAKMGDADRQVKYPGANAPSVVLTNSSGDVNIALDRKPVAIRLEELKDLEPVIKKQMAGAKINSSGIRKINGHDFLVIDMDTRAIDATIRNVMAMTSDGGRLLVISYNCPVSKDASCGVLGTQLIDSIRLGAQ